MKTTTTTLIACLAFGFAAQASAQSISPAWDAYRKQAREQHQQQVAPVQPKDDSANEAPQSVAAAASDTDAPSTSQTPLPASPAPVYTPPHRHETPRNHSGAFVGVQAGKGWIYEDMDQTMYGFNAGYRWRAGAASLVGFEIAGGQLDRISDYHGYYAPAMQFGSAGATARFNFGDSPMFAMARLGYWHAEPKGGGSERGDGGYAGFGFGVDLGHHVSLMLAYTAYVYANDYSDDRNDDVQVNRADLVDFGVEVRF
ncbi:hypothetical protein [Pseudoxanthomonas sp. JBR18]|uniref:hypothetical protein n=1 Tax=Pseudoxanthomonas sp. JBR18 TaxID=2969308 RepID=UPI00230511B7|nr:hypothetical protein [Pseudoxanthomonas sp. JBR18]WCE02560.1 hypothetical protein PJ250_10355 [Pseudoxanthomonas sp. JBR18]